MPTEEKRREMRASLIGQLTYLLHEIDALRDALGRVPEVVLEGRPLEGELSIKEMYGLIAASDRDVFQAAVEQIVAEDDPALERPDLPALVEREAWNERAMDDILEQVRAARERLVDFLEALPPAEWARTARLDGARVDVYGLAHFITQHDADLLRAAGYRFHESRFSDRDVDTPR